MAQMAKLDVWVVYDESGDYAVGVTAEDAAKTYCDEFGEVTGELGIRQVRLSVSVPLPTTIEADVAVPDPGDETPRVEVKAA